MVEETAELHERAANLLDREGNRSRRNRTAAGFERTTFNRFDLNGDDKLGQRELGLSPPAMLNSFGLVDKESVTRTEFQSAVEQLIERRGGRIARRAVSTR